jgi:Glycosyltransferase family 87
MADIFRGHFSPRGVRILAISSFVVFGALFVYLRLTAVHSLDRFGNPLAPDLAQFYVAGEMARHGEWSSLYDPAEVWRRINDTLEQGQETGTSFFYPPFVPWFCVPLTLLPYAATAWIYMVLSVFFGFALGWVIPRHWPESRPWSREACWLFVASVPFWRCVLFGQNGLISLALLWVFYVGWNRKYYFWSGLVLAAGAYKPQLFAGAWIWLVLFGPQRARVGLGLGLAALIAIGYSTGAGLWEQWYGAISRLQDVPGSAVRMHSLHDAFTLVCPQNHGATIESLLRLIFLAIWLWAFVALRMRPFTESTRDLSMAVALLGWGLLTPRLYQYDLVIFYPLLVGWWCWIKTLPKTKQSWWRGIFVVTMAAFYLNDVAAGLKLPILTAIGALLFTRLCYNILGMNIRHN